MKTMISLDGQDLPPLPMDAELWKSVVRALRLAPQLGRVTECVVRGMSDEAIADAMGIKKSTVRVYFDRIFMRTGARGRMAIMRKVLTVSLEIRTKNR